MSLCHINCQKSIFFIKKKIILNWNIFCHINNFNRRLQHLYKAIGQLIPSELSGRGGPVL